MLLLLLLLSENDKRVNPCCPRSRLITQDAQLPKVLKRKLVQGSFNSVTADPERAESKWGSR